MSDTTDSTLTATPSVRVPRRASAIKITLCYAIVGALWILCSDWVLHHMMPAALHEPISMVKGWLYVAVTASLLGWVLDRYFAVIRRSAQQLLESEERWKHALEGAAQAVWDRNAQTNQVHYSPEWKAMLGYEPHEIGDTLSEWESRLHPEDLPRVQAAVQRHLEGQTPAYMSEHRLRCKDGSYKWILDQGKVTSRSPEGRPLRMVGTHSDVHRRKQAEAALAASETNFRTFFQTTDDLIVVAKPEGRIVFGNAAVERKLGFTADELAGMTVAGLHPPEVRVEVGENLAAMFRGERRTCPLPLARKNGELLPVETRVWLGQWDGQQCLFGLSKDLSAEQEAQQRFERLFRHNPMPMALSELPDQRFTDVNDAWLETLGYERDEVIGKTDREMNLFANPEEQAQVATRLKETGEIRDVELQVRTKNGAVRDGLLTGEIVRSHGKHFSLTVMVDITDRKKAEAALHERLELQDQLAKVAATVPGMICSFRLRPDGSSCMPFSTPAIAELHGLQPEDVREDFSPILAQVHPEDRDQLQRSIAESARTLQPWHDVFRARHPQKGEIWVEGQSVPRREPDGSILWHGFVQDVTDRKRSEEAARREQLLLRTLIDLLPDNIYVKDTAGRFLVSNLANAKTLGKNTPDEVIGLSDAGFFPPPVAAAFRAQEQKVMAGEAMLNQEEETVFPDGRRTWGLYSKVPWFDAQGRVCGLVGIGRDITERRLAEEALRASELKYRVVADNTFDWEFWLTPEGRFTYTSPSCERITGHRPEEFETSPKLMERIVHADDRPRFQAHQHAALHDLKGEELEFRVVRPDGEVRWIAHVCAPIRNESGSSLGVRGSNRDITERKQAEEALRKSEGLLRQMGEVAKVGGWEFDVATGEGNWTEEVARIHDLPPEMPISKTLGLSFYQGESRHRIEAAIEQAIVLGVPYDLELELVSAKGTRKWVHTIGQPVMEDGRVVRLRGAFQDITERKRAEAALELEATRRRMLIEGSRDGIVVLDQDGKVFEANRQFAESLGYTTVEVLQLHVWDWDRDWPRERVLEAIRQLGPEGSRFETRHRRKDGSSFDVELSNSTAELGAQRLVFCVCHDITERKQAEDALRQSEDRYRLLVEESPDGIGIYQDDRLVFVNSTGARQLAAPTKEAILGRESREIIHPDDRAAALERIRRRLAGDVSVYPAEVRYLRLDGTVVPMEVSATPVQFAGKPAVQFIGRDISDRKRAEAQLRESLLFRREAERIARIGAWKVNLERDYLFWTEGVYEILGYPLNHTTGFREGLQVYDREYRAGIWAALVAATKDGTPFTMEAGVTTSTGQHLWVEVRGLGRVEEGEAAYVMGTFQDITERRQAEKALKRSEAALLEAQRLAKIGNWESASPSGETVWSPEMYRLYGRDPELGPANLKEVSHYFTPESWALLEAAKSHAMASGIPYECDAEVVRPDGTHRWVTSRGEVVRDAQGRIIGLRGTTQDITERKRVAEALQESQEMLEKAQAFGHVGSWVATIGSDSQIVWSDETCRLFGLMPGQFDGASKSFFQLVHPEDRDRVRQAGREADINGEAYELDYRICRPDGQIRWLHQRADIERADSGRPLRKIGTVQDITEWKRAEARAARDNLRTNFLLEFHQRAPQMTDKELYDHVLERAVQLTGSAIGFFHEVSDDQNTIILATWNAEALKNCSAAFATHYPLKEAGNWVDCVRQQRPVIYNDYVHSPNQRGLPVGHSPVHRFMSIPVIREGKVRIIFGVGNKASDYDSEDMEQLQVVANELHKLMTQRAAENQLRQLSRAVEQSPVSVIITDTAGRIEYVNPKFTQVSGYSLAEVRGQNPRLLKSGEMDAEQYRQLWQIILAGHAWRGEFQNRKKNGELHWEAASISPITDPTGKITHFVAVKEDVTERKRLESQLRQAQKLEAVGQLAGGVAHDFNNILAAIMMHLGLLHMNNALDKDTRQALKELDGEARRAASLTRQLLMFSRRSVLTIKPQDLNDVVANLLKMLTRLIGENIKLNLEGGSRLPSVEADTGMLEQVLMNLVVNARDAMPKGGRISISTSSTELVAADVALNPERRAGRFVCLAVSDTGTGMDEATLKRIFEPFFTTKEAGKGTGLGLATVHGIVAQHKGWVEVESQVGQGTTFRVFLPAMAEVAEPTVQVSFTEPLHRGQETILLVEDDGKLRQMVGQTLRAFGYQVHEAANGQEAMSLWQKHGAQVDLLFTDIVMPEGITGLELMKRLQRLKPGLRVIISSGYSAEIAQAGVPDKAGVVYLPKPYEAKILAATVRNCLKES